MSTNRTFTKPTTGQACVLYEPVTWLAPRQRNVFSQFGEDGLVDAVLEHVGIVNRWCFEVGAADGIFYSNTKRLRDAGWSAVLIEAEDSQYVKLATLQSATVHAIHYTVGPCDLDRILAQCGAPLNLDLGVIDVDGQDWHVFDGLKLYRPRVLLVECAVAGDDPAPPLGGKGQASVRAICELGVVKGYVPVCSTFCNVLFVEAETWAKRSD